jgi:hypothetical protein
MPPGPPQDSCLLCTLDAMKPLSASSARSASSAAARSCQNAPMRGRVATDAGRAYEPLHETHVYNDVTSDTRDLPQPRL